MKLHLKRNRFICLLLVTALAISFAVGCSSAPAPASGSAPAPAPASGSAPASGGSAKVYAPVELNFCHFLAAMHPLNVQVLEPFAKEVEEKTDGRVKIFVYPSNELAAADKNYDATVSGIIDMGLILPAYTPGLFPLSSILEFPFMFSSPTQSNLAAAEVRNASSILDDTEYKDVVLLWWGTTDLGHFLMKKPIKTIGDLQGMKLRSPSTVGNDVLTALGATPVTLPVSDTYDAIERSIVDGTMLPISTLVSFNLGDVVKEVLQMNMYATPLHMVINKSSWAKISPEDQKIIQDMLAEFPERIGNLYAHEDTAGYAKATEKGIPVVVPTEEELQKFKDAVEPLVKKWLDDMEAKGVPGWDVYNQLKEAAAKYN